MFVSMMVEVLIAAGSGNRSTIGTALGTSSLPTGFNLGLVGKISGTYLHGLFTNDAFRTAWLQQLGLTAGPTSYSQTVEDTLDALADHMETHLDVSALLASAAPVA